MIVVLLMKPLMAGRAIGRFVVSVVRRSVLFVGLIRVKCAVGVCLDNSCVTFVVRFLLLIGSIIRLGGGFRLRTLRLMAVRFMIILVPLKGDRNMSLSLRVTVRVVCRSRLKQLLNSLTRIELLLNTCAPRTPRRGAAMGTKTAFRVLNLW